MKHREVLFNQVKIFNCIFPSHHLESVETTLGPKKNLVLV